MAVRFNPYLLFFFLVLIPFPAVFAQNRNGSGTDDSSKTKTEKIRKNTDVTTVVLDENGDTLKIHRHSPRKATWMSAALPGLGQIYNRKYWKLPIIYVGFGVVGYLAWDFQHQASLYKESYMFRIGSDPNATDHFPYISSKETLYEYWNYYRRNFEITLIAGSLLYILNIIDASVDAHLYKFDISDDLSFKLEPSISTYRYTTLQNPSPGVRLTFSF